MAKRKIKVPDKDAVLVKSRTYGEHYRAKRGSKTPATLNSSLQKSTEDLEAANKAARLIKSALDPFRHNFMGGLIWQKLVKQFKQQAKAGSGFHTGGFKRMDIWDLYPLDRFRTYISYYCEAGPTALSVELSLNQHPDFKRKYTDSYCVSMLAIFPDFEKMEVKDEACNADLILLEDPVPAINFKFAVPEGAQHYLLVLKLAGAKEGEVTNHTVIAMQLIGGGRIEG